MCGAIEDEGYIRTKTDEFVIKSVVRNTDTTSVTALLNTEELEGKEWEVFESVEQTVQDCLALALAGTGWTVGTCEITKKRTIRQTCVSTWDIIQDVRKTYLCELQFDSINKQIHIYEHLGTDRGVYFMDTLNFTAASITSDTGEFYTRILPIGKDGLKLPEEYIENHQYSDKVKTLIWKDERYTVEDSLREDASAKLDELSKPARSYGGSVIDLAAMSGGIYSVLSYGLGDTITLVLKDYKVRDQQRIVKLTEYPDEPERNTCELANRLLSLEDLLQVQQQTTETVNNITSDNGSVSASAMEANISKVTAITVITQDLQAVTARIGTVEANYVTTEVLDAQVANINKLTADEITALEAMIADLRTVDLAAINADIDNLKAGKADITALNAAVADIGSIYASLADINTALIGKANVVDLNAANANINNLTADIATINEALIGKASITDLQAAVADIGELTAGVADINTLLAGSVAAGSTQTIVLNAENTTIDQALIKNVIAKHISVADLVAGDINTTKFRVTSESGRLLISDNTMQIKDAKRVRVQVGKDASGDYTLAVWDSSGNLMWDARGAKAAAIKDKIIRDDMVSDDANIAGSKINLPSLITEINGQTQTIKSSLIAYDPTGQTLDVMMSQMTTDISGNANNIATLSTQLNVEQGKIATLITESTQTKDDLTTLTDKYNSTVATVDGLSITLGAVESKITNLRVGGVNRALRTATPYVRTAWSNKSNDTKQIYTVASDIDGQSIVLSFDLTLTDVVTGTGGTPRIGWQVHDTKNYPYSTYITNLADGTQHIVIKGNAYKWTYPLGIVIQIRGDYIVSGTATMSNLRLVTGDVEADWSPAPEDTDSALDTMSNTIQSVSDNQASINVAINGFYSRFSANEETISTHTEQISTATETANSAQSTATTAKETADSAKTAATNAASTANTAKSTADAAKTAADTATSKVTTLTTEVQTAKSQVSAMEQTLDSFGVRLGNTETSVTTVTERIDNLQVGGINLIQNSEFKTGKKKWNLCNGKGTVDTDTTYRGRNSVKIVGAGSTIADRLNPLAAYYAPYTTGESLIFKVWVMCPDVTKITGNFQAYIAYRKEGNEPNGATFTSVTPADFAAAGNNTWFAVTVNSKSAVPENVWCTAFVAPNNSDATFYVSSPKLEYGTMATDWSPAPEDTDDAIETVKDSVKTVSDKQASMELTLNSFGTRLSSAESTVTTHTEQISTATQTAESAKSTATTAKTTADAAKTAADNAKSTANTAKSTADAAKTAADTATSKVTTLTTEVQTAKNQVSEMSQTLNSFGVRLSDTETAVTTVTERVENLQVGGRNHMRNGDFNITKLSRWWTRGNVTLSLVDGTLQAVATVAGVSGKHDFYTRTVAFDADSVTISFDAKASAAMDFYVRGHAEAIQIDAKDTKKVAVTTEWARYSVTYVIKNASKNDTFVFWPGSAGTVWLDNLKVEAGNVATDFTLAPEDTDDTIETVKDSIKTVSDKQASMELTLDSFGTRLSSTETTITTHTEQISTATETANAAKSTATTAKTTADAAKTAATNAANTANTAKSTADAAKTAADTATSKVTTLTTEVQTAKSQVSAMEQTLDSWGVRLSDTETNITTVTERVENLQIGSVNRALKTATPHVRENWTRVSSGNTVRENVVSDMYSVASDIDGQKTVLSFDITFENVTPSSETESSTSRIPRVYIQLTDLKDWPFQFKIDDLSDRTVHLVKQYSAFNWKNPTGLKLRLRSDYIADGSRITISNLRLVVGDKEADWSPAPEDTDSAIETVKESVKTVSDKQAQLTVDLNGITGRVSSVESTTQEHTTQLGTVDSRIKTAKDAAISSAASTAQSKADAAKTAAINAAKGYTDGQLTTVNETLSTHTSEISALQGAINLKVEQTDIDNTLANIKYGGNNLLQDSDFPTGTKKWNLCNGKATVDTKTQFRGRNSIKIVGASNATSERLNPLQAYYSVHTPGETLTLRVWLMCPDVTKIANNVLVYIAYRNASGDAIGNHELRVSPASFTAAGNNKWFAVVVTGKTDNAGCVRNTMILSPNNPNATIYVSSPKLEYGTVPTDWSPAPTDLQVYADKAVSALQASIKITTDNITSSVTDLQSRTTTVEGKVQEQETRLKAAEQKITADAIISTVSSSYYKKSQTDSLISSAKSAAATDAQNKADAAKTAAINAANANTANLLLSYSTTEQMNSAIEQKANSITSTVGYTASESAANVLGNKVINGNFNSGLTGWTSFPSAQYSVVTVDGQKAVSLFKNNSAACGIKRTILNLMPGDYILSFWFKGAASVKCGIDNNLHTATIDADEFKEYTFEVFHAEGDCTVYIEVTNNSGYFTGVHLLPVVSSKFEDLNSQIQQLPDSITQTVSQTYATKTELGATNTRVETTEQKLTATGITTLISSSIGGGAAISTTKFTMDASGFTVKNGAIKVQNTAGTNVMWVDTNGNLATNTLAVYGDTAASVRIYGKGQKNLSIESTDNDAAFIRIDGGNGQASRIGTFKSRADLFFEATNQIVIRGINSTSTTNAACNLWVSGSVSSNTKLATPYFDIYNNGALGIIAHKASGELLLSCDASIKAVNLSNSAYIPITASAFNNGSLESTKTNIKPFSGAVDIVQNCDIYEYDLKANLRAGIRHKQYGFVIGDNRRTPAQVVSAAGDSIDQYSMAAINWQATKEIIRQIQSLENQIKLLKEKLR